MTAMTDCVPSKPGRGRACGVEAEELRVECVALLDPCAKAYLRSAKPELGPFHPHYICSKQRLQRSSRCRHSTLHLQQCSEHSMSDHELLITPSTKHAPSS
jgi:hypothetical protein